MFVICLLICILPTAKNDVSVEIAKADIAERSHSADQLVPSLIRHHDALKAVSLVYESIPRSPVGEPEGNYWRRAISVSAAGLFFSDNSHGHRELSWHNDPFRKCLSVNPIESTLVEKLNRIIASLDPNESDAIDSMQRELIFEVLCWWPFADLPPRQFYGHPYSMRALLNDGSYRLLLEKQLVGAKLCYVFVVNDILTVWCDCDQPECVLKSERYNPRTRAIDSRFEMMEYVEFPDSIWLPKKFRITRYDSEAHTPLLREKVVFDSTFLVSDIKINEEVLESDFRQNYAPGTVRAIDSPEGIRYEPMVEGQLEHFNSILNWCRRATVQALPARRNRHIDRCLIFVYSFLIGCGLAAAVSLCFAARRKASN